MSDKVTPLRAEVFLSKVLHQSLVRQVSPLSGAVGSMVQVIIDDILANGVGETENLEGLMLDIAKIRGYHDYLRGIYRGIPATCPGPIECIAAAELPKLYSSALPAEAVIALCRRYERPPCDEVCSENHDPDLRLRVEDYTPIENLPLDEHVPVHLR